MLICCICNNPVKEVGYDYYGDKNHIMPYAKCCGVTRKGKPFRDFIFDSREIVKHREEPPETWSKIMNSFEDINSVYDSETMR